MNSNSSRVCTNVKLIYSLSNDSIRSRKKKNLVHIPIHIIVHRIFHRSFGFNFPPSSSDIAPQYLFLWPRSNRFGCAPFRYFILFYFFFDSRIIAGSSCMDGLEIEKEQLCAWHTAVTCAQWTHRGQASTAVLISCLWIFLYHSMHAR